MICKGWWQKGACRTLAVRYVQLIVLNFMLTCFVQHHKSAIIDVSQCHLPLLGQNCVVCFDLSHANLRWGRKIDFHIWACFHFFSFKIFALTFIELFDPIPCWLWYVGLILVFCLTSRFRLSSKFSAFPAFIIDNINISAKTLNRKWILFNLIRLGKQRQKDTNIDENKNL